MTSSTYDQLLRHSKIMLIWAREENWTALLAEESKYVAEVERLNMSGAPESPDFAEAHQQSKIL
ncbi:MAG: hypothetical protein V7722_08320, partial [Porticoccus sp.]